MIYSPSQTALLYNPNNDIFYNLYNQYFSNTLADVNDSDDSVFRPSSVLYTISGISYTLECFLHNGWMESNTSTWQPWGPTSPSSVRASGVLFNSVHQCKVSAVWSFLRLQKTSCSSSVWIRWLFRRREMKAGICHLWHLIQRAQSLHGSILPEFTAIPRYGLF